MNPVNETYGDICPKGHYCPQASSYAIPCSEGTYNNWYGAYNVSTCLPCTAGMYCSGTGRALPNGDCDVGWYCPEGSIVPQPPDKQCLAGHMCPQGSPSQTPCSSGYYQPLAGQGACTECPAGEVFFLFFLFKDWLKLKHCGKLYMFELKIRYLMKSESEDKIGMYHSFR